MKLESIVCCVGIGIILSSCSTHYIAKDFSHEKISELTVIVPASVVDLIPRGKGNRAFYNDSLSEIAKQNVMKGLVDYLSPRINTDVYVPDSATEELIDFQLFQMVKMIEQKKKGEMVPIPPSVDSVMAVNQITYAVCAIHYGFSRERGNYGAQVAKSVFVGLLTLGSYYPVPIKAGSDLTICIVDGVNNQIVFHDRAYLQDFEPVEKPVTDKQIDKIFSKFFTGY